MWINNHHIHWECSIRLFHVFKLHSDAVILITLLALENVKSTCKEETRHSDSAGGSWLVVLLMGPLLRRNDCVWFMAVSALSPPGTPDVLLPDRGHGGSTDLRSQGSRSQTCNLLWETWARRSPYRCLDAQRTRLLIESRNAFDSRLKQHRARSSRVKFFLSCADVFLEK